MYLRRSALRVPLAWEAVSAVDVDTRSDIYSLGVLLYELLTGSTPFDTKALLDLGLDDMRRIIRDEEPMRPSTRLRQTLSGKRSLESQITHQRPSPKDYAVPVDLDWIVMKAMEKDRSRRYATANGLAADIRRFLNEEPVSAAAPSVLYKFRKFARRNKLAFTAGIAVLSALVVGLSIAAVGLSREREARAQAEELQYASDIKLAMAAVKSANMESGFELLDRHIPGEDERDLRGWEWRYLDRFRHQDVATLPMSSEITEVDVSPDGASILLGARG